MIKKKDNKAVIAVNFELLDIYWFLVVKLQVINSKSNMNTKKLI